MRATILPRSFHRGSGLGWLVAESMQTKWARALTGDRHYGGVSDC